MSILESCPACGSSDVAAMSQQNRALSQTVGELLAEAERLRDGRAETVAARLELAEARAEIGSLRYAVETLRDALIGLGVEPETVDAMAALSR